MMWSACYSNLCFRSYLCLSESIVNKLCLSESNVNGKDNFVTC